MRGRRVYLGWKADAIARKLIAGKITVNASILDSNAHIYANVQIAWIKMNNK